MANDIERMLEINSRIEKGMTQGSGRAATKQDLDRIIESYDQQVYGQSQEPVLKQPEHKMYSAEEEMERLRQIEESGGRHAVDVSRLNMPSDIVESILNNPLDMKIIEDPRMKAFTDKLDGKMPGIRASVELNEKLERADKEAAKARIIEEKKPANASIDYEMIKMIVENVIDKKLGDLKKSLLNESRMNETTQQQYVPTMKLLNFKDKFFFVDNDSNVFECEMKYKGKQKKKTK